MPDWTTDALLAVLGATLVTLAALAALTLILYLALATRDAATRLGSGWTPKRKPKSAKATPEALVNGGVVERV